jgi:hypothetical protein
VGSHRPTGRNRRRADIANRRWTSRVLPSKWSRNGKILPETALRQGHEQRLRLGDLGHCRGRREAIERGREDGARFDGAGCRLVELRQRKRRAKFKTARALLLRDGDGGQEGFFRRRGVGGVALEQSSPRARCSSASNVR